MGESDFLKALLAFESGVDPELTEFYNRNWRSGEVVYWMVESPGQCCRRDDGSLMSTKMTIEEYFSSIGLGDLSPPLHRGQIREAQYRTINALGFVGFQFGEEILTGLGYYCPLRVNGPPGSQDNKALMPSLYVGEIDHKTWANGRRSVLLHGHRHFGDMVATHVNEWKGAFTKKDGVRNFEDLRTEDAQISILYESFRFNIAVLEELADLKKQAELSNLVTSRVDKIVSPIDRDFYVTLSGLLAAAHLRGPQGVMDLFEEGTESHDEGGTSITKYLHEFSHYALESSL